MPFTAEDEGEFQNHRKDIPERKCQWELTFCSMREDRWTGSGGLGQTERISRVNRVEGLRLKQRLNANGKDSDPDGSGEQGKEEGTEYTVHWECRGQVEGPG